MNNLSSSSSTDGLVHVPFAMHHRDGGYLCLEPNSHAGAGGAAAIAFDRDIIPCKKYVLEPKGSTLIMSPDRRLIRTKADFFNALDRLIGREVAIKDVESQRYLTSEKGMPGRPSAKFKENIHFFFLGRTDTGAYYFRTGDPKKHLYLRKSSKTKSWAMKGSSGRSVDIDTSQVNFRTVDKASNAKDWIIEPDDSVVILDSLPTEEGKSCYGKILFLGVVDIKSADNIVEASYHFRNVPAAWRSKKQWDEAIHSIKSQLSRGIEYCIHTDLAGRKTKWIAKSAARGKLCVVIASSNFHQEHLEESVERMEDKLGMGLPTGKDLSELGWQAQTEEVQSTEEDDKKLLEKEKESGTSSDFQEVKDVPVSLLNRSGGWFTLQKDGSDPDSLYLEPINESNVKENDLVGIGGICTKGDYFSELNRYSKFAIKNESGEYLFSRERQNVFGKEKKHVFKKKYLVAEYAALDPPGEPPEMFVFGQNSDSGSISIMSISKRCFLSRNRKGEFVFMARAENTLSSDAAGGAFSTKEEDAWFIDAANLQSGGTSDGLLFACVIRLHDKKVLVSRHAPGRPTAWRTTESWDYITDLLIEDMSKESSTVVTDSDTGHKWFATNSGGKELFVVIATEGFPLHYGTKTLVAMEDLYRTLDNIDGMPPSSSDLYRVIRSIETEYRYALYSGNDEVLGLIQEVDELTDKMMANFEVLKENIAIEEELLEKSNQLHLQAQQFKKKANKTKWKIAAAAVAGGAVVGGVFGWLIGGPAGVIFLETQVAEIALGCSLGAAPGVFKGVVLLSTDKFWKRKFVNFGRCIDSRLKKRARAKRVVDLEQKGEGNKCTLESSNSSWVII